MKIQLDLFSLFNDEFEYKKQKFLSKLKSSNGSFKRYLGSPLRYMGGKSWAVGYVVSKLPKVERLISPFFGGGSVEIAVSKELGIPVLGFDIFDILVNYWQVQIKHPKELHEFLKRLRPDKETYKFVKEKLRLYWQGKLELDKITLAGYYFFNHNLSYGPMFLGWMSSVYANEKVYKKMIERVLNFNVKNLWVECDTFENVIKKYNNDFLYCDPPYYLGEDSEVFRGLYPNRNFPIHHKNFDHKELRNLLFKHKGGFILSYNYSETIKRWYSFCDEIIEIDVHYTLGQGETRIGKNRKLRKSHIKKTKELIIAKYPEL
ncbi:MAG: DNA adenine methylase [Candidatus Hydrothermia bacterium]|jgi:DNA adenine methylase|nr:DNA adenine methylase [Candidatus Hydrothermia bacterium]